MWALPKRLLKNINKRDDIFGCNICKIKLLLTVSWADLMPWNTNNGPKLQCFRMIWQISSKQRAWSHAPLWTRKPPWTRSSEDLWECKIGRRQGWDWSDDICLDHLWILSCVLVQLVQLSKKWACMIQSNKFEKEKTTREPVVVVQAEAFQCVGDQLLVPSWMARL